MGFPLFRVMHETANGIYTLPKQCCTRDPRIINRPFAKILDLNLCFLDSLAISRFRADAKSPLNLVGVNRSYLKARFYSSLLSLHELNVPVGLVQL